VLFVVIFVTCWLVFVGGMLFDFIETFALWRLHSWPYHFGPVAKVIEEEVECPGGLSMLADVKSTLVTFRVLKDLRCVFRRSWFPFEFRVHTSFEIKGTMSWSGGRLTIIGRYPLGAALCLLAWVDGWTVFGVFILSQGDFLGLALLAFGWIFASILWIPSRYLELKRFATIAGEVRTILEGNKDSPQLAQR
jgi:hypothetical protein